MSPLSLRPVATGFFLIVAGLFSTLAFGAALEQSPTRLPTAVVTANAPIFVYPKPMPTPLRTAAVGTRLEVLDEQGAWVQVRFNDPQLGLRVGWIESRLVRIDRPELRPIDLSVPPDAAAMPASGGSAAPNSLDQQPRTVPPRPQAPARPAYLDEAVRTDFERGWIDVNLGFAFAAEKQYTIRATRSQFSELATFEGDYSFPTGADFDFGGGLMLTRHFGLGLSFSGTAHQDTGRVRASVPHPTRFNLFASDDAETSEPLTKAEGAAHIHFVFAGLAGQATRLRAFAGPTYFRVKQDTYDSIRYNQVFQLLGGNQVTITGASFSESEGTAWGVHVGGDFSQFFTRVFGVGAVLRYSRATVKIIDLLDSVVENKAGGLQAAGGIRLKF